MSADIEEVLKTFMRQEVNQFLESPSDLGIDTIIQMLENFKEFKQDSICKNSASEVENV